MTEGNREQAMNEYEEQDMSDIIERLRDQKYGPRPFQTEAADRIEKLEAALREIINRADPKFSDAAAMARAALAGTGSKT